MQAWQLSRILALAACCYGLRPRTQGTGCSFVDSTLEVVTGADVGSHCWDRPMAQWLDALSQCTVIKCSSNSVQHNTGDLCVGVQ